MVQTRLSKTSSVPDSQSGDDKSEDGGGGRDSAVTAFSPRRTRSSTSSSAVAQSIQATSSDLITPPVRALPGTPTRRTRAAHASGDGARRGSNIATTPLKTPGVPARRARSFSVSLESSSAADDLPRRRTRAVSVQHDTAPPPVVLARTSTRRRVRSSSVTLGESPTVHSDGRFVAEKADTREDVVVEESATVVGKSADGDNSSCGASAEASTTVVTPRRNRHRSMTPVGDEQTSEFTPRKSKRLATLKGIVEERDGEVPTEDNVGYKKCLVQVESRERDCLDKDTTHDWEDGGDKQTKLHQDVPMERSETMQSTDEKGSNVSEGHQITSNDCKHIGNAQLAEDNLMECSAEPRVKDMKVDDVCGINEDDLGHICHHQAPSDYPKYDQTKQRESNQESFMKCSVETRSTDKSVLPSSSANENDQYHSNNKELKSDVSDNGKSSHFMPGVTKSVCVGEINESLNTMKNTERATDSLTSQNASFATDSSIASSDSRTATEGLLNNIHSNEKSSPSPADVLICRDQVDSDAHLCKDDITKPSEDSCMGGEHSSAAAELPIKTEKSPAVDISDASAGSLVALVKENVDVISVSTCSDCKTDATMETTEEGLCIRSSGDDALSSEVLIVERSSELESREEDRNPLEEITQTDDECKADDSKYHMNLQLDESCGSEAGTPREDETCLVSHDYDNVGNSLESCGNVALCADIDGKDGSGLEVQVSSISVSVESASNQLDDNATEPGNDGGCSIVHDAPGNDGCDTENACTNTDCVAIDEVSSKADLSVNEDDSRSSGARILRAMDIVNSLTTELNKKSEMCHTVVEADDLNGCSDSNAPQLTPVPRGLPKSRRPWKTVRSKVSTVRSLDSVPYAVRMNKARAHQRIKQLERRLRDEKKEQWEQLRQRREANKKRAVENERKGEVCQVIRNPSKIKRMKKKQLRTLQTRDTTVVQP